MMKDDSHIVSRNQPCHDEDGCASSDAMQIYSDGHGYCFSCEKHFKASELSGDNEILDLETFRQGKNNAASNFQRTNAFGPKEGRERGRGAGKEKRKRGKNLRRGKNRKADEGKYCKGDDPKSEKGIDEEALLGGFPGPKRETGERGRAKR